MLVDTRRRSWSRLVWTAIVGFFLGGLLTELAVMFLPPSAARTFLTTAVTSSAGPLSVDLLAVDFTLGPVSIYVNVLTIVGITVVAFVVRSWI